MIKPEVMQDTESIHICLVCDHGAFLLYGMFVFVIL